MHLVSLFQTHQDSTELKKIKFHGLRQTRATRLRKTGENIKAVSERLGHATITIIHETHARVLPNRQADAARKCDAFKQGVIGG